MKLEPEDVFTSVLPLNHANDVRRATGKRPNIIPDGQILAALPPVDTAAGRVRDPPQPARWHNYDVKTIHRGTVYYATLHARLEQSGAVRNREGLVHSGYLRHARELDRRFYPQGNKPVEGRLLTFGAVRGFIFGAYGEASMDVHELLEQAASKAAASTWQIAGARQEDEMRSYYLQRFRRRLGMASVLAMARHRLSRVPLIGVPRSAVEQHMQRARARAQGHGQGANSGDLTEFFAYQAHRQAE